MKDIMFPIDVDKLLTASFHNCKGCSHADLYLTNELGNYFYGIGNNYQIHCSHEEVCHDIRRED